MGRARRRKKLFVTGLALSLGKKRPSIISRPLRRTAYLPSADLMLKPSLGLAVALTLSLAAAVDAVRGELAEPLEHAELLVELIHPGLERRLHAVGARLLLRHNLWRNRHTSRYQNDSTDQSPDRAHANSPEFVLADVRWSGRSSTGCHAAHARCRTGGLLARSSCTTHHAPPARSLRSGWSAGSSWRPGGRTLGRGSGSW